MIPGVDSPGGSFELSDSGSNTTETGPIQVGGLTLNAKPAMDFKTVAVVSVVALFGLLVVLRKG